MSRFYIPKEAVSGDIIHVTGEEAHHILNVMRLKERDKVTAFDGTGKEYSGYIKKAGRRDLTVEVTNTRLPADKTTAVIRLIQAIPKKDKMDYIVEKSTELGVHSILPVITERTIVRWDAEKARANAARWRKIAREASRQCGRHTVPVVEEVKKAADAVAECAGTGGLLLMATLNDDTIGIRRALSGFAGGPVAIAIGPEGDFTPSEADFSKSAGFKPVSLGPRVLKSDTAGLAALAILNYEFEDRKL